MYRLVVVDDEAIVRKGLRNLIDWNSLDCQIVGEAADGQEMLEQFDTAKPDIVLTDIKMPRIDGLELCRRLRKISPHLQIIMLTAYSDFDYARKAIHYGVTDYVTKSGGMLEVINAVQHAIEHLEERRLLQARQNIQEQSLEAIRDNFLKNTFTGFFRDKGIINERAANLGMPLDSFVVFCLETDVQSEISVQLPGYHSLKNFLALAFQEWHFWCVPLGQDLLAAVLSCDDQVFPFDKMAKQCADCLNVLQNMLTSNIFIGVSDVFYGAQDLQPAYMQAKEALGRRFLDDNSRIYLYQDKSRQASDKMNSIDTTMNSLMNAITAGDKDEAIHCLDQLFFEQKRSNSPAELLKSQALTFNERCGRLLAERGIYRENIYEHDVAFFKHMSACRSMDEYKALMRPLVMDSCRLVRNALHTAPDSIILAERYITDHACNGITLDDVATAVHLSPSHLAHLYKETTGSTVKADINALRLSKAKQILRTPGCTVQNAADAIGMNDLTYFSHFFKKYTNMSPKQYQIQTKKDSEA